MIKYTTKDILVRATQLADLENSDFISWNENINLLNESWQKIYQELIDNGDKSFIKEMDIDSKVTELPRDFYELFSVELIPSCYQIHRKAKSESEFTLCYDIENNNLIIYGNPSGKVRIKYFPNPQTLTLQNVTKNINDDMYSPSDSFTHKLLDCYKIHYLYSYHNSTDNTNTVELYNIKTKNTSSTSYSSERSISNGVVGKRNSYCVTEYVDDETEYNIVLKTPNVNQTIAIEEGMQGCLLKNNDEVGCIKKNGSVLDIFINEEHLTFDMSERISTEEPITFTLDSLGMGNFKRYTDFHFVLTLPIVNDGKCTYVQLDFYTEDGNLYIEETYPYENFNFGLITDTYRKSYLNNIDDKVCLVSKDGFYINKEQIFLTDTYTLIGVNEINTDNGYGISVIDSYDTEDIMLHSVFTNTFLYYPNNIYLNFMSILMAMSYKIKQGGNADMLGMKLSEMENQYFDTLSRDVNNVVRITNVY